MSEVSKIYQHIVDEFKGNQGLEIKIQTHIGSLVTQSYHSALNSEDGYCYKFNLPIVNVLQLFTILNLKETDVEEAFRKDWKYPHSAVKMYSD